MEDQPTVVPDKEKAEIPAEPSAKPEESAKPNTGLPPDIGKMMNDIFKNLGVPPPPKVETEAEPQKAEESPAPKPGPTLSEILKLVTPILMQMLLSRPSDIPERGTPIKVPKFRKSKTSGSNYDGLLVQIIIGHFSFIVTRTEEDKYLVLFRRDTTFQRKLLSAKELYKLLKTISDASDHALHFGLLFNNDTLDVKVLRGVEITKKNLKKTIRYFLSLL